MEFMAVAAPKYDIARFGAEFPRFSPRQADLLIDRRHHHREAGARSCAASASRCASPSGSIAFGVCASTGGFYQNYCDVPGADQVIPVDVYIPGCPPRPEQVLDGADACCRTRSRSGRGSCQMREMREHERAKSPAAASRRRSRNRAARRLSTTLKARCPRRVVRTHQYHGDETVVVDAAQLARRDALLRDEPAHDFRRSICTAVDYLGRDAARFEVV